MSSLKLYRNIGIILWIIAMVAFGAFHFGKLNTTYMLTIGILTGFGEMIMVLIIIKTAITNRSMVEAISSNVLIPKGKFNDKQMHAGTYIFSEPIISTNTMRSSIFKIYIELAEKIIEPLEFSVIRVFESATSEQKLDASHCSKEGTHILHINVHPSEKLNFKFNRDVKTKLFSVDEVYIP